MRRSFLCSMDASQREKSIISPDNSEDGAHPLIADQVKHTTHAMGTEALLRNSYSMTAPQNMPAPPTNYMQSAPGGLVSYNHAAAAETTEQADAKRRRLDVMPPQFNQQLLDQAAVQAMMVGGRGRKKSQAQIDRRRERNRILARRTRLRKKFFFESLQKEVMDLQRENELLKDIVKEELQADDSKRILDECDAMERLPNDILEQCAQESAMDNQDINLVRSIQKSQHAFVITDPSLHDNPIVFASDDFLKTTGYKREQVLGRNCRFLQGTDTSLEHVKEMSDAISRGEDVSVTILNYKADGTPFWNKLFIAALRDSENSVVNNIGVIVPVPGPDTGHHDDDDGQDDDGDDGYDSNA